MVAKESKYSLKDYSKVINSKQKKIINNKSANELLQV